MTGAELIAAERTRQIEVEGWTAEHDAAHAAGGDLIEAARCYAFAAEAADYGPDCVTFDSYRPGGGVPRDWPWDSPWWKPTGDPIRDLVKAGALIAAEIDRRASLKEKP